MKSLPTGALVVLLAIAAAGRLSAQYQRQPGDTLRYREVLRTYITVESPQGTIPLTVLQDATIALTFGAGDTATAWYEALAIALQTPSGDQRPEATAALRQPFILKFDARGRVATLRAPQFPASFEDVSDLTKQFFDYFPRLPSDFDLSRGRAWSDTVVQPDSGPGGRTFLYRRTIDCRVVGDTTVDGEPGRLVETRQHVQLSGVGPVRDQPLTALNELSGVDSGVFVFSSTRGRLLSRARSGVLLGTITYVGATQRVVLRERFAYTNTVDRVP